MTDAASQARTRRIAAAVGAPPYAFAMAKTLLLSCASALALAAGCAGSRPCPSAPSVPATFQEPWVSQQNREHPLVGRAFDARTGARVDEATLAAAVARADFVLLGETHDNPDHHQLQARMLRAVTAGGRLPALAVEMLDVSQQPAVDAALKEEPRSADAFGAAVKWSKSGWPPFAIYRPVFEAAIDAGLPIVAANLSRKRIEELVDRGPEALGSPLREELEKPLTPEEQAAMREEMRESHCGKLPEFLLDPMVLGQRARDGVMAERMVAAGGAQGAVLVAGTGHVRTDRGVPAYLAKLAPGRSVVSIAFLEASADGCSPADYASSYGVKALPFDYVVFTPRTEREDPCNKVHERVRGTSVRRRTGAGATSGS